jgi:REP element-mobilizing transposase RayT
MEIITQHPQFFTASIYKMKHLLKPDKYKQTIVDSLQFLVNDNRIFLFSFCIMSNHIHLIWQIRQPNLYRDVQRDFLKFTAQKIRFDLIEFHPQVLSHFEINGKDRKYQFWQRNPLSVELYSNSVFRQKLDYIHSNPVKAGISETPEGYSWSSASFYKKNDQTFPFLKHWKE